MIQEYFNGESPYRISKLHGLFSLARQRICHLMWGNDIKLNFDQLLVLLCILISIFGVLLLTAYSKILHILWSKMCEKRYFLWSAVAANSSKCCVITASK